MKKILFAFILLLPFTGNAQIITTIAGNGTAGYSGDGGLATAAEIASTGKVVVDGAGNIYFSDFDNSYVRKVSAAGIITTIAGTGVAGYNGDGITATSAKLNKPYGLALDDTGNLYIADSYNERIRKVSTTGIITTVAGNGTGSYSGDGGLATLATIWNPNYVFVDHSGNIFITDNQNARIRKVNIAGVITTVAGNGSAGYSADGVLATSSKINYPAGIFVDNANNLYIADNQNARVRKVNAAGIISTIAGTGTVGFTGDGGLATGAEMNQPLDVSVDGSGDIYIADGVDNRIRAINSAGIISTYAGNGTAGYSGDGAFATLAELNGPNSVFLDNSGSLYITDRNNYRVRKISGENHAPHFIKGPLQTLTACETGALEPLDSMLAVLDSDAGQMESWSLAVAPLHGVAVVTYTTTSTGDTLFPVGLSYTPTIGYTGTDVFKVTVSDGTTVAETEIDVTIDPLPDAGTISGTDSVCPGHSVTLVETVTGGIWSTSSFVISDVTSSGIATGLFPGNDTIIYTVINACGIVSAIFPFKVPTDCHTGVSTLTNTADADLNIFPNPAYDVLTITSVNRISNVAVSNLLGQTIYSHEYKDNRAEINVTSFPAGVYFVRINGLEARKIIKQ